MTKLQIRTHGDGDAWRDRGDEASEFLDGVHTLLDFQGIGEGATLTLTMHARVGDAECDVHYRVVRDQYESAVASYEAVARRNRSDAWDTIEAVGFDRDGDIMFEVIDHAMSEGFINPPADGTDDEHDAIYDALAPHVDALKARFRDEWMAEQAALDEAAGLHDVNVCMCNACKVARYRARLAEMPDKS